MRGMCEYYIGKRENAHLDHAIFQLSSRSKVRDKATHNAFDEARRRLFELVAGLEGGHIVLFNYRGRQRREHSYQKYWKFGQADRRVDERLRQSLSTRTIEKSFKIPTYDRIHKHVLSIAYLLNLKEYRSKIKEDDCSKSD